MQQPDKEDQMWSSEYTVRGESNYLHRMYYFLHRFGLQSNIICSARYKSDERDAIIDRSKLYAVLKSIIDQYPELAIVGVMESSPKPGRYRLRRALLHRIHLHTCTEFIETQDGVCPDLLERLHGEWLWTAAKPDKPWWKVVVVNGQEVVFVFHHFVCDGRFGYLFHKAFAEALNAMPRPSASPAPMTDTVEVDAAKAPIATMLGDLYDYKGSILRAICTILYMYLIRLIYGSRLFFADVPKQPFVKRPIDAVVLPTERVVTRVKTCRIPAAQVEAIVTACRARNTTFTPLLIVMINLVLATEHYPAAKLGLSFCAIDTRPCLPALPTTGKQAKDIMNASASIMIVHRLEAIRRAASPAPTSNAMPALTLATPAGGGLVAVDADAIWKPVQEYGARLRNGMEGPVPTIVRNVLQGKMAGEDLEDMLNRGMPSLGLIMNNGFLVSNLGPFSTPPAETRGCCGFWQVSEVQFSAAVTQASAGASGIVFNVAGVKGGDTIINASYQDGALRARSVEAVLSSVAAKMVYVANTTLATKK